MSILPCREASWVMIAAEQLARAIRQSVAERGVCHLALAGGSTPKDVYLGLLQLPQVPFDQTEIWFSDERCVPGDHPSSNHRMAQESLLSKVETKAVHRMRGEDPPEVAAKAYARIMPERMDVVLLGMGADGHTASLFPGSPLLSTDMDSLPKVAAAQAPVPPHNRLTFCPAVLRDANSVIMLVRGGGKASALQRALQGPLDVMNTPSQLVRDALWIVDEAAAAQLELS